MHSLLKSSLLVLLTAVLSQCQENRCPTTASFYHLCLCSSKSDGLVVGCDSTYTKRFELQNEIKQLSGKKIKFIRLDYFNMEQMPPQILNGLIIEKAVLSHTDIGEMPAFKGSENTLQELKLSFAVSEQSIEDFTLNVSHLNKLKSLTFEGNYYNKQGPDRKKVSVGNDWFENGPISLEKVYLRFNDAKSVGDRVFSKLLNLKEIDLSFNRMEEVHRSMFPDPARQLQSLNLQGNRIKSLPEDFFSHMPVLRKVDVMLNSVSVLDERTWSPVWEQLEDLKLGTALTCDSSISWTFGRIRPKKLDGRCDVETSNDEYKGRHLDQIIDEKRRLSSNAN